MALVTTLEAFLVSLKPSAHDLSCDCSVCWAKHYCNALALFPDPYPALLSTVNYADNQAAPLPYCNMTPVTALNGRGA